MHLIGRDMQETERRAIRFRERGAVSPRLLQQAEGTVDVGANEIVRPVDGAIDVAFSREVDDGARLFPQEQFAQQVAIDDVALLEPIMWVGFDGAQVVEIARVSQFVKVQNTRAFGSDPLQDEVRANEARATGDEDQIFHGRDARGSTFAPSRGPSTT